MSLVVDYETLKVAEAKDFKWETGKYDNLRFGQYSVVCIRYSVEGPTEY